MEIEKRDDKNDLVQGDMSGRTGRLNCLFIVQGEGRGHMTQALALAGILRGAGHDVCGVLVGESRRRALPSYFLEKIGAPVETFRSPNFETDRENRAVRLTRTLFEAARRIQDYRRSLGTIRRYLEDHRPNLLVNFYEPLAGVYYGLYRPATPMVCVGHQYLVHHEIYPFPDGSLPSRAAFKLFTDLTALGASKRLALSFYPSSDVRSRRASVVPPLLRAEVFEQQPESNGSFLLAYILNSGYADRIITWHASRPETVVHCFWDNREAPDVFQPTANLTFHQLDDEKFLRMMARCHGLICTAGFESICEAMYLRKPVMMVPVEGHFEQACNALDALAAGAGIVGRTFDVDRFLSYVDERETSCEAFRAWADMAADVLLGHLEAVVQSDRPLQRSSVRDVLLRRLRTVSFASGS